MLTGITVIDFTRYLSGSYCSMRLADMGAEVIKIESFPIGEGVHSNQRQTILLNLKAPQGRELAFALAAQADVVMESFRPGVMGHLGLDYASLVEVKPDLIYCSLTGYGQTGLLHQLGGHDLNYQALSGFLSHIQDGAGRPVVSSLPVAEYVAGMHAAEKICAALVYKLTSGQGSYLDINMVQALSSWTSGLAKPAVAATQLPWGEPLLNYHVYETAEGRFVALAALELPYWLNFCNAVARPDWEEYAGQTIYQQPEVYEELRALFLTRTQQEWHELGIEVDCCLTMVKDDHDDARHSVPPDEEDKAVTAWLARTTAATLKEKLQLEEGELYRYQQLGVIP